MRVLIVAAAVFATTVGGASAQNAQPEIYALTWTGLSTDRVDLTNNSAFDGWPVPSPDEREIAFVSTRSGFDAVWIMNSDGSNPRRVTEPLDADVHTLGGLTWSPDGRRIAFTARLEPPAKDVRYVHYFVYVVSSDGGAARRLDFEGWGPMSFSADSKLLAYSVAPTSGTGTIVARSDGSGAREVLVDTTQAIFAPHDRRILILQGGRRVSIMDPSGHVRWTLRGYSAVDTAWMRDGRIVFLADGLRRPGLYVVRPGSGRPRRIVDIADGLQLVLSPDSRYASVSASGSTYIVRIAGGYFRRAGDEAGLMAWSTDGRELAFTTELGYLTLAVSDISGPTIEFGFPQNIEYFGLAWNGGRLLFASSAF